MTVDPKAAAAGRFPSTLWSRIRETGAADLSVRRAAWDELAQKYWRPIYAYIRAKWNRPSEEATDLAQDFFAWMLETDFPGRADPERGRFRIFVKTSLENYLRNDEYARRRQKRGGDRRILELDGLAAAGGAIQLKDPSGRSPEEILEGAWTAELLSTAARVLEERLRCEAKEIAFALFRDYYLAEGPQARHEDLATRYGVSASDVHNSLKLARQAFRRILEDLVQETVDGPDELREELQALFGPNLP
jgi:RNA polymerase sigma-70 factor (ECF subfamily)